LTAILKEGCEREIERGRTYVRNGSVVDLQIAPGKVVLNRMTRLGMPVLSPRRWLRNYRPPREAITQR
jgi:hypothetical protein